MQVNEKSIGFEYEIKDGKIILNIDGIKIDAVPFKGNSGYLLSFRSRELISKCKLILMLHNLTIEDLFKNYEQESDKNEK